MLNIWVKFSADDILKYFSQKIAKLHSAVGSASDRRSKSHKFESLLGHIIFPEIDCEIFSSIILPLWLIQERQLSVSGKSICIKYWLTTLRTKPVLKKKF